MLKIIATGRLGKDCTVNTVNGKNVINFSIAHSEKYRDAQGNNQEKTTWIEAAYWVEKTGIAPYLTKGAQVLIEGTPEVRSYTKTDGTTGTSLSVRVRSIELLGGKGGDSEAAPQPQAAAVSTSIGDMNDDLPF